MGYGEFEKEIEVEWDILSAASHSCLAGRARGFIEREIIQQTPASITWRLWMKDLGEFGTFEIRKIRAGWSNIHFSGIGHFIATGLSNDQIEIKKQHMNRVIQSYFSALSQENIFINKPLDEADQTETQFYIPWEQMPGATDKEKALIKTWCIEDKSAKELSKDNFINSGTIYNYIGNLRKKYKKANIPRGARERANFRIKYISNGNKD